jgi:hypothetical protein
MIGFDNLLADFKSHPIEGIAREGNTPFSCPLITQVDGNLWQGGCLDRVNLQGYFKHIISLYPWERFIPGPSKLDSFVEVALLDGPIVPDEDQLFALAQWINVCRKKGTTLVHCQAGLNRSSLLTGLALILGGLTPDTAIRKMRDARSPAVLCNKKFEQWLLTQK